MVKIVPQDGFYKYVKHKTSHENQNCEPTIKESQTGILLLKGLKYPNLGCCPYTVNWELVKTIDF